MHILSCVDFSGVRYVEVNGTKETKDIPQVCRFQQCTAHAQIRRMSDPGPTCIILKVTKTS